MKTVLAYGDSLTWGMNAATGGRHAHEDLWPTVLGKGLGAGVQVINTGLNGRTTAFDDYTVTYDRNGARLLPTVLGMFEPIDVIVLLLGTNDIKISAGATAVAAAQGMKRLIEIVKAFPYLGGRQPPACIVVAPPKVLALGPSQDFPLLSQRNDEWATLAPTYRRVAADTGAAFFDAAGVASAEGGGDGIHLDAKNTRAIGEGLVPVVKTLLGL